MDQPVVVRGMRPGEETRVSAFVEGVFDAFVAPLYAQEGADEFMRYIQPDELARRTQASHFALVAETAGEIVGVIEFRNCNHVSLLFVDARFQRRGVGRELLRRALEACRAHESGLLQVSVNASLNAVAAYERMGFRPAAAEQCVHGIRFVPMVLRPLPEEGG